MRLTPEAVAEIRRRYAAGEGAPTIAADFGVTASGAWAAATGRSHRDLPMIDLRRRVLRRRLLCGAAHPLRRHPELAVRGSAHVNARLTEEQVADILAAWGAGESQRQLARLYGVSRRCINFIVYRVHWRHVADPRTREAAA